MPGQAVVRISNKEWSVSMATTYEELTMGLSGVSSIPAGTGMLFDLGADYKTIQIDMTGMLFPLDIIFINSTQGVVGVMHNVQPGLRDVRLENDQMPGARFFLEVNAGEATGIEAGDNVEMTGDIRPAPLQIGNLIGSFFFLMVFLVGMGTVIRAIDWALPPAKRSAKRLPAKSNSLSSPEKVKRYRGLYLTNWQYGGYSYIEEDPTKPPELWVHGMVDYANPEKVIAIAEREGMPEISLAGGFWERIGYKGWGEKVSLSEAKRALGKAKEYVRGQSSSSPQEVNMAELKRALQKEAWEERLAYETYQEWAEQAERLGKPEIAAQLREIAQDEWRHNETLERIVERLSSR